MNAETFYRKRLIELSDSKTMEKINSIVELKKQAQICQEYHEYKLKLLIIGDVSGNDDVKKMDGKLITYCSYTHSNRNKLEIMVHGEENYVGNTLKSGDKVEVRHYR